MAWKKQTRLIFAMVALFLGWPLSVAAQSSSNYRVEEAQFGTGGEVDMNSPNYNAQGSAGSLGVGSTSSNNYDAEAGFLTPNAPFLEFVVDGGEVDLGVLTPSTTGTGTGTFYVRSYLSEAYVVLTLSQPPTSEGGAQLVAMASTGPSVPGSDQFGINLVDNNSPNIGAEAVNVPDDSFADGGPSSNYGTTDQFRYAVGDIVARSAQTAGNQAVGRTNYTVSYIANVSGIAAAGSYTMDHDLMVIATY